MGQFKALGLSHGYSDRTLSMAASFTSIAQVVGRFSGSCGYDIFGLKPIFLTINFLNFCMAMTVYKMVDYPVIFYIIVYTNFFCYGSLVGLLPTPIVKTYGPRYGSQVFTFAMAGGIFSSLISTLMMQFLYKPLGLQGLFQVVAGFAAMSFLQMVYFDEKIDIERLDAKGLIVWGKPLKRDQAIKEENDDDFERVHIISNGPSSISGEFHSSEIQLVVD